MSMEMDHGPDQEPEKYSFLQEKIKEETFSRKKMLYKISWLVGKGILFGIAASIGFFAVKPLSKSMFPQNPNKIEIPKDEDTENNTEPEQEQEPEQQEFTIQNYRELNAVLIQTALEAKKSVVKVSGIREDGSVTNVDDTMGNQSAGVIVADNGQELLVLTNMNVLSEAVELRVSFIDEMECSASLKKKDANIGMAVIAVNKSLIKDTTWERIKVAELGNSNAMGQGKSVIALGNLFGCDDGMGFGIVSSSKESIRLADGEYNMLVTDMAKIAKSSGVLFNLDGSVVGMIAPDLENDTFGNSMSAYAISSIKSEIELMLNAKDIPYIGIIGTLVTEEIAAAQNIPKGICVTEVEADSPAMKAGIQNGDIITHIGKKKIESIIGYHRSVIAQQVDTEIALRGQRRGAEDYVEIGFNVTVGIKE